MGSSLSIEFFLNQNQGQIGSMCLEKRSDCIKNGTTVAGLCDSPASTITFGLALCGVFLSKTTNPAVQHSFDEQSEGSAPAHQLAERRI
jgi:hypothetical protein